MQLDGQTIEAIAVVVSLLVAGIGGFIAFVHTGKRLSGKIDTSEASHLWEESSKLREEYRSRLVDTDVRQAKLEERVAGLEAANNLLVRANMQYEHAAQKHDDIVEDLRTRFERCEMSNKELKEQVDSLKQQLKDANAA